MKTESNPVQQWWVGPNLPTEHVVADSSRESIRRLILRPAKRHIAQVYGRVLTATGTEVIGITGSAGKTTTKEMVRSVLSERFKTRWSPENIDPVYSIPHTTLKTPLGTQKLVLEMGIEFPGEMDFYLWLTRPKTGIVTSIYWTHTEFLGDLGNVLHEKGKLIESLPKNGFAILNADDENVATLAKRTKAQVVWYGTKNSADVVAKNVHYSPDYHTDFTLKMDDREVSVSLPLFGKHFVLLALAAACVGKINNLSLEEIKRGLEKVSPMEHRMVPIQIKDMLIIDDSYNANPLATMEAIKALAEVGKNRRKIFVLGEMKQLGSYEVEGHKEVGLFAKKMGVEYLFGLGPLTQYAIETFDRKKKQSFLTDSIEELIAKLKRFVAKDDVILIKGSRSMSMDRVVNDLIQK